MSISFDKSTQTFYLDGKGVTYAFFINNYGFAEHLYYGKKIHHDCYLHTRSDGTDTFPASVPGDFEYKGGTPFSYPLMPPEVTFFGTGDYRECTVHVKHPEGDRLTDLLYDGYEILENKPAINGMPSMDGGETLVLHLYDKIKDFGADLYYTVYDDCDVIARRIVYKNCSEKTVKLDRAYSFAMGLPGNNYDAITLHGGWANERNPERVPLHYGVHSIDSKRATSSAALNPFMAVVEHNATETFGEAYGFNLVYSSSHVLKAEVTMTGETVVLGGINDFDFEWTLGADESFETPEVVIAYSCEGIGGMSRAFHDAYRNHLINKRFVKKSRPILINNWEGTYFNFTPEKLMSIADAVAGTGIDTFVLDDGWFGVRNNERSGLGDWFVNETKMPAGIDQVINHVNSKGMKFGLWFEPEMISEDSDIYRAHPEYAIKAPDRPNCYARRQLMMDLTNPEVRNYIVDSVNKMLKNHNIGYVKWDYNRNVTEFFGSTLDIERQSEFAHRYALGVYDLCERIVNGNPDVFFEGCSGGGARFDPAMMYYFAQTWCSDNSDAEARTMIQYGTSMAYPLSSMSGHISAVPNHQVNRITPMQTRADIAHLCATGYELDTTDFTDEDRATVAKQIEEYKRMERLVLEGDLYRINSRFDSNHFAFAIVSKDKSEAHLTCYQSLIHCNDEIYRVKMQGLDPNKKYYIPEKKMIAYGSTLMNVGMVVSFGRNDFVSRTYHFEEK